MKKSIVILMLSRDGSKPLAKKLIKNIKDFLKSTEDREDLTIEEQWKLACLIYKEELEPAPKYSRLTIGVGALKQFVTKNLVSEETAALKKALNSGKNLDQLDPEMQNNVEKFLSIITREIDKNFFSNITKIYWDKVSFNDRLNVLLHLSHLKATAANFYKSKSLPKIEFAITEMFTELLPTAYRALGKNEQALIKGIRFILNQVSSQEICISHDKLFAYFNLLLKNINELDNLKLNHIIDTTIIEKKTKEQIENTLTDHGLLSEFYDKLPFLSHTDEERFLNTLMNLKNNNLLDKKSVDLALQRITSHLKYPEATEVEKELLNLNEVAFKLENPENNTVFFVSKPRDSGTFGTIYKGYLNNDATGEPVVTVKAHHTTTYSNCSNYSNEYKKVNYQEQAIREIKYQKFIGNQNVFYFLNEGTDSYSLVFPWKTGKPMSIHYFANDNLNTRLQYSISLLTKFDYLHHRYRIHGDVKANNVVVDEKNTELHLIDYGTARKNASKKQFAGNNPNNFFKGEMTALSDLLQQLFATPDSSFNQPVKDDYLIKLVHNQLKSAINEGQSSERLLKFCQTLVNDPHLLNEDSIKETAGTFLFIKNNSLEDVFRM